MRVAAQNESKITSHLNENPSQLPELLSLLKANDKALSSDRKDFIGLLVSQLRRHECSLETNITMMK